MLLDPHQLEWFKQAWPGPIVRSTSWLFSFGEILHFIGLCLLLGSLLFIDLRLMGFYRGASVRSVLAFLPWTLFGFLLNAFSGWIFFTSNPASYIENPAFLLKMLLIVLAGLNAAAFTLIEHRAMLKVGPGQDTPALTKMLAGSSLLLWFAVLLLGRWLPIFTVGTN
ncbi:DUF6644 family protein [Prosthecomicrobium sp. N25]|uniref:DUF6644 family protein n=1 Tax=Prosthecomicrobium sp. N25 TaxID=3129254 RepID=UPI003077715F